MEIKESFADWDDDMMTRMSKMVRVTAAKTARQFRQHIEFSDSQQDCWEWVINNRRVIHDRMGQYEDPKDRKNGERYIAKSMSRHCNRVARQVKAAKTGYKTHDEFFYSDVMVLEILKFMGSGVRESVDELPSEVRSKRQSHPGGMDFEVMVADVEEALDKLETLDRSLVMRLYVEDEPIARVMMETDLSRYQVESKSSRALFKMLEYLGGESPWR